MHKNIEILKKFGFREPMFNSVRFGKREKFQSFTVHAYIRIYIYIYIIKYY